MKTVISEYEIRVYPLAAPDAEERDIFFNGSIEILTAPILKGTPGYAAVRLNYSFGSQREGVTREEWDRVAEAMQEAFKISAALRTESKECKNS